MKFLRRTLLIALIACMFSQYASASDVTGIGVMRFGSGDAVVSDRQAGIITDIFISALANSPGVKVYERRMIDAIGRETSLGMSWLVDPSQAARIGKLAGVPYIVTGNVTLHAASGGKGAVLYGAGSDVTAVIDVRIIDSQTSRLRFSGKVTGHAQNPIDEMSLAGMRYARTGLNALQERAVADAVRQAAAAVLEDLAGTARQDSARQYSRADGFQPLGSPPRPSYAPPASQARQSAPKADPDSATDPSLVYSFPLDGNAAASLEARQRAAQNMLAGGQYMEAYAEFRTLSATYGFDYLSAYWAGVAVARMNMPDAASAWFDKALSINPRYRPAIDAKARLK